MDPVDEVVFSKRLKKPKGEVTLFIEAAQFIQLPTPPPNSSFETGKDLLVVQGASFIRNQALENSIQKHDKDPSFAIKRYMDIFGLEYDTNYIEKVLQDASILITAQKNKYNRPRPSQLAPYFGVVPKVYKSKTAKTPSYPSGHTTQARLIAEIYAEKYPDHRINLLKAAEECGSGRISGGLHYPLDHKVGIYFAKRLFKALKERALDKKPISYDKVLKI